jgi:LmbE family N-acetylglucosaminyl deacetylase
MNVLVAAPHPDDDMIGCGGSLIGHIGKQKHVAIVYMTSGDAGSLHIQKNDIRLLREKEAREAAAFLGIHDLLFLRMEDGYLQMERDSLIAAVRLIREKRPDLVYIPHEAEYHRDHRVTHDLFIEAIRRAAGPWFQECGGEPWAVKAILGYEVGTPLQRISYVEDISAVIDLKTEAIRKHASQLETTAYDEAARALSRYRGIMTGRGLYCECFEVYSTSNIY